MGEIYKIKKNYKTVLPVTVFDAVQNNNGTLTIDDYIMSLIGGDSNINLFTSQSVSVGKINNGVIDSSYADYCWVKFDIISNTKYLIVDNYNINNGVEISFFNGATFIKNSKAGCTFTTPSNCTKIGVTINKSIVTDISLLKIFKCSDKFYSLYELAKLNADVKAWTKGLNIALLGDSIINYGVWIKYFKQLSDFGNYYNYGIPAAGWAHNSSTVYDLTTTWGGYIWNQANRLINDYTLGKISYPNVILLDGGANDGGSILGDVNEVFNYSVDFLTIDANNILCQSVLGAIRKTVETIKNTFPDSIIILATPIPRVVVGDSTTTNDGVHKMKLIGDTILLASKLCGTNYIDKFGNVGIDAAREYKSHLYLSDGVHPNEAGGLLIGKYMSDEIKRVIGHRIGTANVF